MNIKQALEYGIELLNKNNIESPNLKTRMLLANILNKNKEYLLIHDTEELNISNINKYKEDIQKLANGTPIQYIINKQEFMGLEFYVDKNVLIPQPDTEILVEEVINICKEQNANKKIKILDLCTGSGAIGISIAKKIESCQVTLSDISYDALKIAQKNSVMVQAIGDSQKNNIKIIQSDLFEKVEEKFDIIVSNPPYIPHQEKAHIQKEVLKEPDLALYTKDDKGLEFYEKIIQNAPKHLNPKGYILFELGIGQSEYVKNLLLQNGFKNIQIEKDLANIDRVIFAQI